MTRDRGTCPVCAFRHPLHKDGTMSSHKVYDGTGGRYCRGEGQPADPMHIVRLGHA